MSGWDAMIGDETRTARIKQDHQKALTRLEDEAWRTHGIHRYAESFKQGYRRATNDVLSWVMHMLTRGFDDLTGSEVIRELRKGDKSLYWPLFIDNQTVWLLCDHCRTRQLFTAEGVCPECGTETTY